MANPKAKTIVKSPSCLRKMGKFTGLANKSSKNRRELVATMIIRIRKATSFLKEPKMLAKAKSFLNLIIR